MNWSRRQGIRFQPLLFPSSFSDDPTLPLGWDRAGLVPSTAQDAERPLHLYDIWECTKLSLTPPTSVVATLQVRKQGLAKEIFVNYNAKHKMLIIFIKQANFLTLSLGLFTLYHKCLLFIERKPTLRNGCPTQDGSYQMLGQGSATIIKRSDKTTG